MSTTPKQIRSKLDPPRNQTARLLRDLIRGKEIAEQDYPFNGFRTRISELHNVYRLPVRSVQVEFTNQYKRKSFFKRHFILSIHTGKAIKLYQRVNSG